MSWRGDQRKHNKGRNRPKKLSKQLNLFISPEMLKSIEKTVKKGDFPNKSEFVRYVIRRYFEKEDDQSYIFNWADTIKRIYNNREEVQAKITAMVNQWDKEDEKG